MPNDQAKITETAQASFIQGKELLETVTQWQLKQLLQYWLQIHLGTKLPSRKDLDPSNLVEALPFIAMMDVEQNPFRLKFRLIGTAVNRAFGRDFTGKYFDEEFEDYQTSVGYQQRKTVAETGLPLHYFGKGKLKYNLDFTTVEWILLPLASNGKDVDIIISAISYGDEKEKL